MASFKWAVISLAFAAALSACGGGADNSPPPVVASVNPFNMRTGYQAMVVQGYTKTYSISGSCTGTLTMQATATTAVPPFETIPAVSSTQSTIRNLSSGCPFGNNTSTLTQYYNSSFLPIGFSNSDGAYGVSPSTPNMPAVVHVGDTGTIGSINLYTDNTKTIGLGHQSILYTVDPDTATTALVNLIYMRYDSNNALVAIEVDSFRMDANGNWTPFGLIAEAGSDHIVGR